MSGETSGYINESYEDFINRLPIPDVMRQIKLLRRELRKNGYRDDLDKRLAFCYKKLNGYRKNEEVQ